MPAYVMVQIEVTNEEKYAEYRKRAPASLEKFGEKFLARGGELAVLEGDLTPSRMVVLEFDSLETIKKWYQSPEYQYAKEAREGAASFSMVAVEGL